MAKLSVQMKAAIAAIHWHHKLLIWALNRCENTPHEITDLIKEKSKEYDMVHNRLLEQDKK